MNHYGISAIHWNAKLGEVDEVLLHKFARNERQGTFVLKHGERARCSDVVNLIRGGDMVWIVQAVGGASYKNTDHVGINVKRRPASIPLQLHEGRDTHHRFGRPAALPDVGRSAPQSAPNAAIASATGLGSGALRASAPGAF